MKNKRFLRHQNRKNTKMIQPEESVNGETLLSKSRVGKLQQPLFCLQDISLFDKYSMQQKLPGVVLADKLDRMRIMTSSHSV